MKEALESLYACADGDPRIVQKLIDWRDTYIQEFWSSTSVDRDLLQLTGDPEGYLKSMRRERYHRLGTALMDRGIGAEDRSEDPPPVPRVEYRLRVFVIGKNPGPEAKR